VFETRKHLSYHIITFLLKIKNDLAVTPVQVIRVHNTMYYGTYVKHVYTYVIFLILSQSVKVDLVLSQTLDAENYVVDEIHGFYACCLVLRDTARDYDFVLWQT